MDTSGKWALTESQIKTTVEKANACGYYPDELPTGLNNIHTDKPFSNDCRLWIVYADFEIIYSKIVFDEIMKLFLSRETKSLWNTNQLS